MSIDFFKLRAGSEFSISDKMRQFSINEVWRNNEALWNLVSAMADEPGAIFYERSVDMVENIADVDICDVKHLEAISYQMGINSGFGFIDSLPTEIYDLINVLSIKPSYLMEDNNVYSSNAVKKFFDEISTNVCAVYGFVPDHIVSSYNGICSALDSNIAASSYVRADGIKILPEVYYDTNVSSYVQHNVAIGTANDLMKLASYDETIANACAQFLCLDDADYSIETQYDSTVINTTSGYYNGTDYSILNLLTHQPTYAIYSNGSVDSLSANTWYFFKTNKPISYITPNRETFSYNIIADVDDYVTLEMPLTVMLPVTDQMGNPLRQNSVIGFRNAIGIEKKFVNISNYVKWFIKDIYKNTLIEHLTCERNFGNESIVDYYKEKFASFVGEYGFQQMLNDGNINYQFYRGLVFSNFCANLTSIDDYPSDWFLSYDPNSTDDLAVIKNIAEDVAKSLTDFTIAVMVRRDLLKKLSYRYAQIGSNDNLEKTVKNYIARNYTKRDDDWRMLSNVAVSNDVFLPTLKDLEDRFKVEVSEYYDNTEYLNISAKSGTRVIMVPSSWFMTSAIIDASGNLLTYSIPTSGMVPASTNELLATGGNERFWESDAYKYQSNDIAKDIAEFYQNVKGSMVEGSEDVLALTDKVYSDCALSGLTPFSESMHRKYIGNNDSYFKAINLGNPDYPTIAPINNLAGLSKLYGNLEREYQSVLNDDRPVVVYGVDEVLVPQVKIGQLDVNRLDHDGVVTGAYPPGITESEKKYYTYKLTDAILVEVPTVETFNEIYYEEHSEIVETSKETTVLIPSSWQERHVSTEEQTFYVDHPVYDGELLTTGNRTFYLNDGYSMSGIVQSSPFIFNDVRVLYEVYADKIPFKPELSATLLDGWVTNYTNNDHNLGGRSDPTGGAYQDRYSTITSNINGIDAFYVANTSIKKAYSYLMGGAVVSGLQADSYTLNATATYDVDTNGNVIPSSIKTYSDLLNYINSYKSEYAQIAAMHPPQDGVSATSANVLALLNDTVNGKVSGASDGIYGPVPKEDILRMFYSTMKSTSAQMMFYKSASTSKNYFSNISNQVYLSGTVNCFNAFEGVVASTKTLTDQVVQDIINSENFNPIVVLWNKSLSALTQTELDDAFGVYGGVNSYPYDPTTVINNVIPLDIVTLPEQRLVSSEYWETVTGSIEIASTVTDKVLSTWTVPKTRTATRTINVGTLRTVTSEIIGFISSEVAADDASIDGVYGMFDSKGGIINSWRNIGVELRGYQSRYEASPNLNQNYIENRFVDYDGPWIGDALYSIIDQVASGYYNGGSALVLENLDVNKLRNDFESARAKNDIDKLTKWWMSDYINPMGVDLQTQIELYLPDILACSAQSIFEFDADSYDNQYTLFKDRNLDEPYDASGVLWMRHANFPLSFPMLNSKFTVDGTDSGNILPYVEKEVSDQVTEQRIIDQISLPSQVAEEDRYIMNHCLAFGVNDTVLYVAGYDRPDGHFGINIYANSYTTKNIEYEQAITRKKFYGAQTVRSIIRMNENTTVGNETYKWRRFAGGYYDARRIIFVFYEESGLSLCIYNIGTNRFDKDNRKITFTNSDLGRIKCRPNTESGNNQLRLVEDVDYFYVGWTKLSENRNSTAESRALLIELKNEFQQLVDSNSSNRGRMLVLNQQIHELEAQINNQIDLLIVCQIDKDTFKMKDYGIWTIPNSVVNPEMDKLIAGQHTVKVKFKSGEIFYGPMDANKFKDFNGNEYGTELLSIDNVEMKYIVEELEDDDMKLPRVPIIDITQWQQWGYSLTTNTLYTMRYADVIQVSAANDYSMTSGGYKYDYKIYELWRPGDYMNQDIVSYSAYTGSGYVDLYHDGTPIPSLTGYSIDHSINNLTPALQQVIPAYGPSYAVPSIFSTMIPDLYGFDGSTSANDVFYDQNGIIGFAKQPMVRSLMSQASSMVCDDYWGLPYNALYAERSDNIENNINRNNAEEYGRCFSRYNYLLLKNFYNYNYNHEYEWTDKHGVEMNEESKAIGWRKYIRCSISRYSDAMWMSYYYLRDISRYGDTDKKRNIASVMNNFEWIELVHGMLQLMNGGYSKSNVFSLKINNSTFNQVLQDSPEGQREANAAMREQIAADIRSFVERYIPAQTQLWKIEFND